MAAGRVTISYFFFLEIYVIHLLKIKTLISLCLISIVFAKRSLIRLIGYNGTID
jgi:hypothetical protein